MDTSQVSLDPDISLGTHRVEAEGEGLPGITRGCETFWLDEARRRGIRLPSYSAMPMPRKMKVWLKRLGMSIQRYYEWSGTHALREFGEMNPEWTLVQWVGIILEWQSIEECRHDA